MGGTEANMKAAIAALRAVARTVGLLTYSDTYDAAEKYGISEILLISRIPTDWLLGVSVRRGSDLVSGIDCLG